MHVPAQMIEAIIAHARFEYPNEACGLLAADETGALRMCYSLTNADLSPVSYTVDPIEHFRSMQHAERNGWDMVGAFHSHPGGVAFPSATEPKTKATLTLASCRAPPMTSARPQVLSTNR